VQAPANAADDARSWFWIEIEFAARNPLDEDERSARAGVPRLARGLLSRVQCYDSLAMLANEPMLVGRKGVDDLIDVLCDPERRLPTVVASAHPELDFEEWRRVVARATHYLPGLASIYILDPLGTSAFVTGIGRSHAVRGGAVRTYLPDVDPAVAEEALRHRALSGARILADPGRATGILSILPRRLAVESPLPSPLSSVNRILLTQTQGSPESTDVVTMQSQVIGLIEERELALALAEEQEHRANAFFVQRESALTELAERDQRVLDLENLVRSLRKRLSVAGRVREALLAPEEQSIPPATFAELLDWLESELNLVEFTGDRDVMLVLERSPEAPTWVRSSWEALRAMQSYADAKGFSGDFKRWCECPPSGSYAIPSGKVARDESETVKNNSKWRHKREFRVPHEVSLSGRVFMGAHIRIGASAGGQISPRLHFYDATSSNGKVYVGYLGRHLSNTRT